ncbi:MAG: 4-hydroxy-3-methylbut-2-enyl diphosphate reductase [Candidatus Goldbacteria bacterium]|nr:4-hydroxy-3-methylbut-2-enyl diphosphate reductase [Candidatus Goldiibacteriota bacterium]
MKIIIAKNAGFCFGVQRAIDMINDLPNKYPDKKIYLFREIIHNSQEVKRLQEKGMHIIYDLNKIENDSIVVVSTHGITPDELEILKKRKIILVDTTCPYVKKIHNIAEYLSSNNYDILIIGDKHHLEVRGIIGYCHGRSKVASSFSEIKNMKLGNKIGIIAQTTQNIDNYKKIIFNIIDKLFIKTKQMEIRIFNTICDATYNRQKETIKIAKKSDVVIIIGGRNSANTKRLYELSKNILKSVYLIKNASEIKKRWFTNKKIIGISAGASTPHWIIQDVIKKIKELNV